MDEIVHTFNEGTELQTIEIPISELGRIHDMFCTISAQLDELLQLKAEFERTMQDMAGSGLMGMIGKMFK